jgi:DNA-binding GntR family transcriptional regulator
MELDPNSQIPLYIQLRQLILDHIDSGVYCRGMRIPSELDLARDLNISRATVRRAISDLANEGVLFRVVGKGTYVLGPRKEPSLVERMTSFADDMDALGIPYSTKVLVSEIIPASAKQAEVLDIQPGAPLFMLERSRCVRGEPLFIALAYIRLDLCPDLDQIDFTSHGLFASFREKYRHRLARATRSLQAVLANEREAEVLNVPEGFPLHLVEDIVYLDDGRPIMLVKSRFRGDRSEFTFEVRFKNSP